MIAHKIQLCPTKSQIDYFKRAVGTARFTWNWALAEWDKFCKLGLHPKVSDLKISFNAIKYIEFPWIKEIHRDAHAQPFLYLQIALNRFYGSKSSMPKFKRKGISRDSFYVANSVLTVEGNKVRLPRIGWIKMTEPIRFYGKIMSATVSRIVDRWFISFCIDAEPKIHNRTGNYAVGVDLGIKTTLTLSDGRVAQAPKPLTNKLKKLRRLNKSLSRKQKGSNNRRKAQVRLAKLHWGISNKRKDFTHKATTTLVRENQAICIEDLNIKGMVRNHKLARHIIDISPGEFRRQLEYKSAAHGVNLIIADRFFPSSKKCSNCGFVKDKLKLSERTHHCRMCSMALDRDLNAAINLRNLITVEYTGIQACGEESSERKRKFLLKLALMKQESQSLTLGVLD